MKNEEARARLRQAMALHSADDIDAALAAAREVIALAPDFGEAYAYLGNTLVTRRRRFADGLAALDQAARLLPRDPAVLYTLGWCREFVAHALERRRGAHQAVEEDASTSTPGRGKRSCARERSTRTMACAATSRTCFT